MANRDDDQSGIPLFGALSDSESQGPPAPAKRKRGNGSNAETKKSAKRRKMKKPKDVDDEALDVEKGVNQAIAHMDSRLMADHMAQRTRRFHPELSLVEVEDSYLPENAIVATTSWNKPRTMENLAGYLEHFAGPNRRKTGQKLSDASQEMGTPHTLVVAGSGLRAADLTRTLRKFQTRDALVAKLFAKHIKFKDAVEMMKSSRINIGVGTPQRIVDLLEDGALSPSYIERIVIDASHIDQKKRGILDMKETQAPLVQLLTRRELKERYGGGEHQIEVLFF